MKAKQILLVLLIVALGLRPEPVVVHSIAPQVARATMTSDSSAASAQHAKNAPALVDPAADTGPSFQLMSPPNAATQWIPTGGLKADSITAASTQDFSYDPTSIYDHKGGSTPRGFAAQAPDELIDPFTGNLLLHHVDFFLPGVAGLDLTLQRVYNSKIHRNYAARASGDPNRVATGMQFVPVSPLGLGWTLHMGRLIGFDQVGANNTLQAPRYYEKSEGSQHPYFRYSGQGCGNEMDDVCLITKMRDNPYRNTLDDPWRIATVDGLNIAFDHEVTDADLTLYSYATEIRDVHGNRIQISYHDNTIPGIAYEREYFRHFIDTIVDSANRTITFGYSEVTPGVVRLTSITALGHTFRYIYNPTTPFAEAQAFLTQAQPPAGGIWRYVYAGLNNGDCVNDKRWCELTQITYPTGGTIDYAYIDTIFYAQTNPMAVRAVQQRTVSGRAVTSGMWTYTYNRGADYTGTQHTVVTRPDNSQEIYTYFGVGDGPYNPLGLAWKAGVLLQKEIRGSDGTLLQTETLDWIASEAISDETWGDPWIGFDTSIFVPRLRQRVIQRGTLTWTATHTHFNRTSNTPRCTTEQGDGATRYRLTATASIPEIVEQGIYRFRLVHMPALKVERYTPFPSEACDDTQLTPLSVQPEDEFHQTTYNGLGMPQRYFANGIITDYSYHSDGFLHREILYHGRSSNSGSRHLSRYSEPEDGYCTVYRDYAYGVARQIDYGAPAPGCTGPIYSNTRVVDANGGITASTDGRGNTIQYRYDALGRMIEIQPPGEATIHIRYDGGLTLAATKETTQQGTFTRVAYLDGFGREIEKESAAGTQSLQTHDALGRVIFQSLPMVTSAPPATEDVGTYFAYDALGRIVSTTFADGSAITYAYDTTAHQVTVTDQTERTTIYTRQAFANPDDYWLVRVQLPGEPEPSTDTYRYLVGGHLEQVDYAGQQFVLHYDFSKKIVRQENARVGTVTHFGYNAAGHLICRDRFVACVGDSDPETRFVVDGLGRVTQTLYADSTYARSAPMADAADVAFTYDGTSNLATITDGVGSHVYDYTPTNRMLKQTSTIEGVVYETNYAYDTRGNLQTLTYPSSRSVTYTYDAGNRMTRVNGYVNTIQYHPNDLVSRISYANGTTTDLDLDILQRPDKLTASGILDFNYTYDPMGNLTSLSDGVTAANSSSFTYDDLDRLTQASGSWGSLAYDYNAAGDRLLHQVDGVPQDYTYDAQGRLMNVSGPSALAYSYDSVGNVIQRGGYRYDYDAENRLIAVRDLQNALVVKYAYDGLGQRALETRPGCGGNVVHHFDEQGHHIADSTATGLILKEYVLANDRIVAEVNLHPLRIDPAALDLGTMTVNASVSHVITLTNRSDATYVVDRQEVSGEDFAITVDLPLTIPAHTSLSVPVVFQALQGQALQDRLVFCTQDGLRLEAPVRAQGQSPQYAFSLAPNSHNAPLDISFGMSFAQDIDASSLTPRTFSVHGMSSGQILTGYSVDDHQIWVQPLRLFKPGEWIHVIATVGLRFVSGDSLSQPVSWQFRTAPTRRTLGQLQDTGQRFEYNSYSLSDAALGDLDGDGDLDVFVLRDTVPSNPEGGAIVLFNQGNGTFQAGDQELSFHDHPMSQSDEVMLGDLDGDGDLDAFFAISGMPGTDEGYEENQVWFNDGAGRFSDSGQRLGLGISHRVSMGDVDGDGDLDLLVSNFGTANVWSNDGSGFLSQTQVIEPSLNQTWVLGDLDGDGDLDAYSAKVNGPDQVWLNNGAGQFRDSGQRLGGNALGYDVDLGDLDGDGDLDAFVANYSGPSKVWLNSASSGASHYVDSGQDLGGETDRTVDLIDMDGDGDLDAVVTMDDGKIEVLLNDGSAGFTRPGYTIAAGNRRINNIAFGDLDGDGSLDAFVGFLGESRNGGGVWVNSRPSSSGNLLFLPTIDR